MNKESEMFDDILNLLDFDYYLNENNCIQLKDLQNVNLNNIEDDEFEIGEGTCTAILDRLDVYLDDYILEDITEVTGKSFETYQEALEYLRANEHEEYENNYMINILENIINPSKLKHRYES